jgi:hypothetical protein
MVGVEGGADSAAIIVEDTGKRVGWGRNEIDVSVRLFFKHGG